MSSVDSISSELSNRCSFDSASDNGDDNGEKSMSLCPDRIVIASESSGLVNFHSFAAAGF